MKLMPRSTWYNKINDLEIRTVPYDSDKVDHLVDQLIRLKKEADDTKDQNSKLQLLRAMNSINDALRYALTASHVVKDKNDGSL
jgi:hypothetical protein